MVHPPTGTTRTIRNAIAQNLQRLDDFDTGYSTARSDALLVRHNGALALVTIEPLSDTDLSLDTINRYIIEPDNEDC